MHINATGEAPSRKSRLQKDHSSSLSLVAAKAFGRPEKMESHEAIQTKSDDF